MDNEDKRELLSEFAEHCHTLYKGCVLENGEYFYQYSTEVVYMIDSFLNEDEKK